MQRSKGSQIPWNPPQCALHIETIKFILHFECIINNVVRAHRLNPLKTEYL